MKKYITIFALLALVTPSISWSESSKTSSQDYCQGLGPFCLIKVLAHGFSTAARGGSGAVQPTVHEIPNNYPTRDPLSQSRGRQGSRESNPDYCEGRTPFCIVEVMDESTGTVLTGTMDATGVFQPMDDEEYVDMMDELGDRNYEIIE